MAHRDRLEHGQFKHTKLGIESSNGHNPLTANPFTADCMLAEELYAWANSGITSYCVIARPRLVISQLSHDRLYADFSDLKYVRSSGWSRCVQCGGNVIRMMPCSLAKSIASMVLWLSCPSSRRMCGSSFDQPAIEDKCFSQVMNVMESMYPDPRSLTTPSAPAGAPFTRASGILLRGNTNRGGMKAPAALMQHRAVMFFSRSPLDTFRTCRAPVLHTTFPGFETVVNPVSSQFHMRVGPYTALPGVCL